jgi:dihydroxyacetone kinase
VALGIAAAFEQQEGVLTELDGRTGDGDLGISMVRGATAIRALPEESFADPSTAFRNIGDALRRAIAGSSGPFYAAALLRAARELDAPVLVAADWARAFSAAVQAISELGGAKVGDRTMLDALAPATDAMNRAVARGASLRDAWHEATLAAERGAAATTNMRPRLGRAAYLGDRALGSPDAGATAVLVWMRAIAETA